MIVITTCYSYYYCKRRRGERRRPELHRHPEAPDAEPLVRRRHARGQRVVVQPARLPGGDHRARRGGQQVQQLLLRAGRRHRPRRGLLLPGPGDGAVQQVPLEQRPGAPRRAAPREPPDRTIIYNDIYRDIYIYIYIIR